MPCATRQLPGFRAGVSRLTKDSLPSLQWYAVVTRVFAKQLNPTIERTAIACDQGASLYYDVVLNADQQLLSTKIKS
ncbi:hypothetical protein Mapa_001922 [Marchantia paleacea]|nr:hypothetical protein Mapa_001922 [Marchantia paleacea]